jgi:transcriptional regulator with XRE-family HTH domain
MGRGVRPKPDRLAEKLVQIRTALGLSQNEIIGRMGQTGTVIREDLSAYERGVREPPLPLLLKYAELTGVFVDVLINDDLDLPDKFPNPAERERALKRFHK